MALHPDAGNHDAIHLDPPLGEFLGQPPGHQHHPHLRLPVLVVDRIGSRCGVFALKVIELDLPAGIEETLHDGAAGQEHPGVRGCRELLHEELGEEHGTEDVGGEGPLQTIRGELVGAQSVIEVPGVVDENVQARMPALELHGKLPHRGERRDVQRHDLRGCAVQPRQDLSSGSLGRIQVPASHDHMVARGAEAPCCGLSDAGIRAGDDHRPTPLPHLHGSPYLLLRAPGDGLGAVHVLAGQRRSRSKNKSQGERHVAPSP
jgi:hypothetical protein